MAFPVLFALPAGVLGLVLAGYCAIQLVRRVTGSFVSRHPVSSKLRIDLAEAGTFILGIETPQMSLADLGMGALTMSGTLREASTGRESPLRPDVMGASVTGVTTTRRPLFRFHVERAGDYDLEISGVPDRASLSHCSFVLSRPLGLVFVPLVLGIILGMALVILAIVLPLATAGG